MDIRPTNPQSVSRVLRIAGYNPGSNGDSRSRWIALRCQNGGLGDVRVSAWRDPYSDEPDEEDREVIAEIARLLTEKGYVIRYGPGSHYLYVTGKKA